MEHLFNFELFEKKLYKEYKSTFTHDGKEYDLNKMFKLTQNRKSVEMPLSKLKWILKYTKVYKKRVKNADTNYPILIGKYGKKWITYDGAHRLSKLVKQEKDSIKVIKVPKYILNKCLINKD
jgi:hypothetical protein